MMQEYGTVPTSTAGWSSTPGDLFDLENPSFSSHLGFNARGGDRRSSNASGESRLGCLYSVYDIML